MIKGTNIDLHFLMTREIAAKQESNSSFIGECMKAVERFNNRDWGELDQEDKDANDQDLEARDGHILAKYETSEGAIYIETEDFENAVIMFPSER
ncbi:MAG: hypothetical protein KBS60_00170 [Phascolarctobacterium sp.]|nr:hypothetical protein [Candidatus Phascolarctobacterium caballi]